MQTIWNSLCDKRCSSNKRVTISLLYYEEPEYLKKQIKILEKYSDYFELCIIDDGSKKFPIDEYLEIIPSVFSVYRIFDDIKWNIPGARNLAACVSSTEWSLQLDIDHIIPSESAEKIYKMSLNDRDKYYLFNRQFDGYTKPTAGTMLFSNNLFWKVGGYDEDFIGNYGQNDPYLKMKFKKSGAKEILCKDIWFEDESDNASCKDDRSTSEVNKKLLSDKIENNEMLPNGYLRFAWKAVQ